MRCSLWQNSSPSSRTSRGIPPLLCALWRVRDVLAHVTAGAESAFGMNAILGGMLRHRFNDNRRVAADGQRRGQRDPDVILSAFRRAAANCQAGTGSQSVRGLTHVLVHGQDICCPLGIERELREAHLVAVVDFVKDDVHIFRARKRVARFKFTAANVDWSHGNGPLVTGSAEAPVMMMAGRLVALDDLVGERKVALAQQALDLR
jgi:uncharacterized protein (TIGR03083 family)